MRGRRKIRQRRNCDGLTSGDKVAVGRILVAQGAHTSRTVARDDACVESAAEIDLLAAGGQRERREDSCADIHVFTSRDFRAHSEICAAFPPYVRTSSPPSFVVVVLIVGGLGALPFTLTTPPRVTPGFSNGTHVRLTVKQVLYLSYARDSRNISTGESSLLAIAHNRITRVVLTRLFARPRRPFLLLSISLSLAASDASSRSCAFRKQSLCTKGKLFYSSLHLRGVWYNSRTGSQ